ncbi:MAG: serpin family protein [bacterium]|nr:serpin family protein [bacterium]
MKRTIITLVLIAALLAPGTAMADISNLIPPFHWTYHSLSNLSAKGLIGEQVVPGKSAFTPEQVVALVVIALKHAENDITKLGDAELSSLRQLANAYRPYFKEAGYDYNIIRNDIEMAAIRAGLTAVETNEGFTPNPQTLSAKAALSVNKFTFDLYRQVATEHGRRNLFISPYSVTSALAMTYAGARGVTEQQMERVLSLSPDIHKNMGALINEINSVPQDVAQVNTANAVWPAKQEKILPEYAQTVRDYYNAGLIPLNYKSSPETARKTINKWVEKQTQQRIKDIIGPGVLSKETLMVLTNAVYFKSSWREEFQAVNTVPRPFWTSPERSVKVLTMSRTGEKIDYAKLSDAEIVELPYKGGHFSMLVLLPDKKSDIETLEKSLSAEQLIKWTAAMTPQKVKIYLPKFKQENDYDLAQILAKMGMPSAFNPNSADFSGMTGLDDIYISNIIHKTFVEVAEEGTEAAAATAVIMMRASLPAPDNDAVVFRAERPFIYLIRDNTTGAILFIGRYTRP